MPIAGLTKLFRSYDQVWAVVGGEPTIRVRQEQVRYHGPSMSFLGGSAYAMARGIADGYHLVTERTFRVMTSPDVLLLAQEMDNCLREVRGEQPQIDDLDAVKARNRKIQRLNTALMILRNHQVKARR